MKLLRKRNIVIMLVAAVLIILLWYSPLLQLQDFVIDEAIFCETVDGWNDHSAPLTEWEHQTSKYIYVEVHSTSPFIYLKGTTVTLEWWRGEFNHYTTNHTCEEDILEWAIYYSMWIGPVGSGSVKIYIDNVFTNEIFYETLEPIPDITCYQCQNETLVTETFNADECPEGWYITPPDCEEEEPEEPEEPETPETPGFGMGILIIGLATVIFLVGKRRRG